MRNDGSRSNGGRRGNVMVVGMMFGVLLGFSALSVDIGLVRLADTQLQAAIDAATLSASNELNGEATGIAAAKLRGVSVAALNRVLDTSVAITAADVQVGTYDEATGVFTLYTGGPGVASVNAVRIDHTPSQVGSVLGAAAFGIAGYDINARSMGVRPKGGPAGGTRCFLPFAVPDCWVSSTTPGTNPAPFKFTFSPTPTDAIAWGDPDGNPSSTAVNDQLEGQCTNGEVGIGDPIYVNEGGHTTALHTIRDILNDDHPTVNPSEWDVVKYGPKPARTGQDDTANWPYPISDVRNVKYGNTLEGPVALVDAGSDCSSVSFTGSLPMTGIAWGVLYDVKSGGAGGKNVYMLLDLINEHEIWGEVDPDGTGNVLSKDESTLINW